MSTLFSEENIVSLRVAHVVKHRSRNLVSFSMTPHNAQILASRNHSSQQGALDWVSKDYVYLYRYMRSPAEERALIHGSPCWEQQLKPLKFDEEPIFRLCWSDSGHSVGLYLNGMPWAFIYEGTHSGYSKGILPPLNPHFHVVRNQWNQELFEKIFVVDSK